MEQPIYETYIDWEEHQKIYDSLSEDSKAIIDDTNKRFRELMEARALKWYATTEVSMSRHAEFFSKLSVEEIADVTRQCGLACVAVVP